MKKLICILGIIIFSCSCLCGERVVIMKLNTPFINIGNQYYKELDTLLFCGQIVHWESDKQDMWVKSIDGTDRKKKHLNKAVFESYHVKTVDKYYEKINHNSVRSDEMEIIEGKNKSQFAEKRIALVIGNSNYSDQSSLSNPINDASDVTEKLVSLGFDVYLMCDLNYNDFETALKKFSGHAQDKKYDVALFYYCGHGIQFKNRQYLVPIDSKLNDAEDLFHCIDLEDDVYAKMKRTECATKLVFIDACRNEKNWNGPKQESPDPSDICVVFSSSPSSTALDGDDRNSPFAHAFLKSVGKPTNSFANTFTDISLEVRRTTNPEQTPYFKGVGVDFTFVPLIDDDPNIKLARTYISKLEAVAASNSAMDLIKEGDVIRGLAVLMNILPDDLHNPLNTFVPESERALRAANDSLLYGRCELVMKSHLGCVYYAKYSSNWDTIATASNDQTIRFWDLKTGQEYFDKRLPKYSRYEEDLSEGPAGKNLIEFPKPEFNQDKTFSITEGQLTVFVENLRTKDVFEIPGYYYGFCTDSIIMTSNYSEADSYLEFWNLDGYEYIDEKIHLPSEVRTVCVSPDKLHIFIGTENGDSYIYKNPFIQNTSKYWNSTTVLSDYNSIFANSLYLTCSGDLYKWSIDEDGNFQKDLLKHINSDKFYLEFNKNNVVINPNANLLAFMQNNILEEFEVFNIQNGGSPLKLSFREFPMLRYVQRTEPILSVSFSNDGNCIAVGDRGGNINIFNINTGNFSILTGHKNGVTSIAFCNNDKYLLTSSFDHTIRVWDIENNVEIKQKRNRVSNGYYTLSAISNDLKYIATSNQNDIYIYDYYSNKLIDVISSPNCNSIMFSKDNQFLISINKVNDEEYTISTHYIPTIDELYDKYKYLRNYELTEDEKLEYHLISEDY